MTKRIVLAATAAAVFVGCATPPSYRDSQEVRTLSRNFTHSDYQQAATAMIDSLKSNPNLLANLEEFKTTHQNQRPKIYVAPIENHTRQMTLKLDVINNKIKSGILNTGLFTFVGNEAAITQRTFAEANGVLVAQGSASGIASQRGADFVLTSMLTELDDEGGRTKENVYILQMQLDNKVSGEPVWMAEKEIRKESKRAGIGW